MVELFGLVICLPVWTVLVFLIGTTLTAGIIAVHVAAVPLIFKYSKTFRRGLVFGNFGHCQLNKHLTTIGIKTDPTCPGCLESEETSFHLLAECSMYALPRWELWGKDKLEAEDLSSIAVGEIVRFGRKTVQWPLHLDLDDPSSCGIEGARNLSLEYQSKVDNCRVKVGIWHILPKSTYERLKDTLSNGDREEISRVMDEELSKTNSPVILYCHGNSNSRGATHRIQLYKFLQDMDFHTIAFDYRGYGDSTNLSPTEAGVVEDSLAVYDWLIHTARKEQHYRTPRVYVWGHSLGSGISSHLIGNLDQLCSRYLDRSTPLPLPKGLILEAPFNNLADEVRHHPLSKLVTWLPYYDVTFVEPFRKETDFRFESDSHLAKQPKVPILILHAKDDVIVPFRVGLKLYRSIGASRSENDACVKLHAYDPSHSLGHKWICTAGDLGQVVGEFVNTHQ